MSASVKPIIASDWVTCIRTPGMLGSVKRVAKDFAWADVEWSAPGMGSWTKRMRVKHLRVLTSIITDLGVGRGVVTDVTRAEQLGHDTVADRARLLTVMEAADA